MKFGLHTEQSWPDITLAGTGTWYPVGLPRNITVLKKYIGTSTVKDSSK